MTSTHAIGIVVIGRNEGERLKRCIEALERAASADDAASIVYVDSGSKDGSREWTRARGIELVDLDVSRPFTAARARNAGFERLIELHPRLELVQFLDGDCVLDPAWLAHARRALATHARAAVVCGRRRELRPEASIWNRLCDVEWNSPIGTSADCGGDALMRVAAFRAVGGFDASLIAGEEPDLCLRLRSAGFEIHRLDVEMTLHDAAMTRWSQWWKRLERTGHTAAEGLAMRGPRAGRVHARRTASALVWGVCMPLAVVAACVVALVTRTWAWWLVPLACVAAYARLFVRIRATRRAHGDDLRSAREYALYCILGKAPEASGVARYAWNRLLGRRTRLIEYKRAEEVEVTS